MIDHKEIYQYDYLLKKLAIDCEKCCGLCCVALYCAKTEGFPKDKDAGFPCENLAPDFHCAIYNRLVQSKMKGCLAYECFGAGQKVTQDYYPLSNWKDNPAQANEIFKVFLIVLQLHQMLWYLIEAFSVSSDLQIHSEINALILENERMTAQQPNKIQAMNIENYRMKVNDVLRNVSTSIAKHSVSGKLKKDFISKDFKKANLDGRDFSMALMIAANLEGCSLKGTNFLGADMRDTNIRNTDLSSSIFLTQMQINAAKGNQNTKLPSKLSYPALWQRKYE